jgi:hypothetical protein
VEPRWTELFDDNDNAYYEAASPYHDDGSPFMWRLRQRLVAGEIEWYEDHDSELMDSSGPAFWPSIEDAKVAIAAAHENIIQTEY